MSPISRRGSGGARSRARVEDAILGLEGRVPRIVRKITVRAELGEGVERVDVNSEHRRTTIKVMLRTDTFAQTIGLANVQRPAGSCAW